MNLNQLMNMIGRMILRRFINMGISKGMGMVFGRGRRGRADSGDPGVTADRQPDPLPMPGQTATSVPPAPPPVRTPEQMAARRARQMARQAARRAGRTS